MNPRTTIRIGRNVKRSLTGIKAATGPLRVFIVNGSCEGGSVLAYTELNAALRDHVGIVTVNISGVVPVLAILDADKVEIPTGSRLVIRPFTQNVIGGTVAELEQAVEALTAFTRYTSGRLAKWPKLQALFDDGDTHFINGVEFKELTGGQHE